MTTLSLRGVSKIYAGGVVALDGLDLDVSGPGILGIVGPSGSGKSTLLRIIAGLEAQSSGHVAIDGAIVDRLAPKDRNVALMFQEHTLFPHMTVEGNLGFGLRIRGVSRDETAARVGEAARALGIGGLLDRHPDQLSGGERQRVALGRALVRKPRLMLLDEPLSSVDSRLRSQLRAEIAHTCRALGAILLFVTHDQMDAMAIADRIAVIRRGTLEQIGDPAALYDHPANRFVAEFIGPHGMNLFDGHLEEDGAGLRFVDGRISSALPADWAARLRERAGTPITLGIRPEGLRAVAAAPLAGAAIEGTIDAVERLGPHTYLHVTTEGRTCTAGADPRTAWNAGARIALTLEPTAIRFFDPDGRSL